MPSQGSSDMETPWLVKGRLEATVENRTGDTEWDAEMATLADELRFPS